MKWIKTGLWIATAIFSLAWFTRAFAGGWAVITLEEIPRQPQVGEAITVAFVVRQHGRTPMVDLHPVITARNEATGAALTEEATAEGEPGRYVASLTFPSAGEWDWRIQAFTMDQRMPTLRVGSASASQPAPRIPIYAGGIGVLLLAAAGWLAYRQRAAWAVGIGIVALLISGAGLVSARTHSVLEPVSKDQKEIGKELFLAKGCTTCHAHEEVRRDSESIYVDLGPNLSRFSADEEYLRRWLKNPAAVKPNTEMPTLGLHEDEIEALIAFINP